MQGIEDLQNDEAVGFYVISSDDIDDLGIPEIIRQIRARIGSSPVYLSVDIDVLGVAHTFTLSWHNSSLHSKILVLHRLVRVS